MKTLSFVLFFYATINSVSAQKSEDFIPVDAVTVFSINNFELLQKISLDDLVKYEFMQEVQQELFDGSTSGKTIKESGLDFGQKLNIYYGLNKEYEISGFSFGVSNINQLFAAFDDFEKMKSPISGVDFYSSYFNHLIIKNDVGVLLRVEPQNEAVEKIADSIWSARGFGYYDRYNYYDRSYENGYDEMPPLILEEEVATEEAEKDVFDVEDQIVEIEDGDEYYEEANDLTIKNYFELKDSIYAELNNQYLMKVANELFVEGKNLRKADKVFADQVNHSVEGTFYLDNSRNMQKSQPFWYYQQIMPTLAEEISNIYGDNKMVGDLSINDNSIQAEMTANYGDALGSIYKEMNDTKFDKNVTKYIHKDNAAYFTYNVDLGKAYDQTYEILMPILRNEKSRYAAGSVMTIEVLHAFLDREVIFNTYKGSMFGTFNGVKNVPVRKLEYDWDEDFNYTEVETFEDTEVPIFTLGFSTKRNDIPNTFMQQMAKLNSEWENHGKYWKIENAMLNSLPIYVINSGGLFILTNDENLAVNNPDGYGADKISRKQIRKTKKSGFMYGEVDWSRAIDNMPREFMSSEQIDMLMSLQAKTGNMVLTSSITSLNQTDISLSYDFNESYENPGKYLLDMVNSLYILMK